MVKLVRVVDLQLGLMTLLCCVALCCVQLTLGSFLALLGLCLEENRHQLVSSVNASSSTPHSDIVPFTCNHQLILKFSKQTTQQTVLLT